jgi:hypothetical protein
VVVVEQVRDEVLFDEMQEILLCQDREEDLDEMLEILHE